MPTCRAVTAVGLLSAGLLALTGCHSGQSPQSPAPPVTIGVLAHDESERGVEVAQAAQLAADLINRSDPDLDLPLADAAGLPGLKGARVELAMADTAGRPDAADAAVAELLTQHRPAGLVMSGGADLTATTAAYADRHRVSLLDAATSAGFLLDVGLEWYFRVAPSDRILAQAVFALLATAEEGEGITVLRPPAAAGNPLVTILPELAQAAGSEVTAAVPADEQAPARLAQTPPGPLIAVAASPAEAAALHASLVSLARPRPVVGMGPGFEGEEHTGPAGMVHAAGWSAELAQRHPLAATVTGRYERRYGAPLTEVGATAFTTTLTLAMAVDDAGTADPAQVRGSLRQLSVPATRTIMPWDGVRFAENGQNELAAGVVEQWTGESNVLVHPPELGASTVTWPTTAPEPGH